MMLKAATSEEVHLYPNDLRELVNGYLSTLKFGSEPGTEGLRDAIQYALFPGGKRIRSVLTMATARSLGVDPKLCLPTAAAIELIHTNSLIVDDLPPMDGGKTRRGKAALHVAFGEDIAMLAGGAIGSEAISLILTRQPGPDETVLALTRELAQAVGSEGMVGGQYLDLKGRIDTLRQLRRLHELKTGSLIAAAVQCALLIANAQQVPSLPYRHFAQELGVLYQIIDDILDVTSTAEMLGKEADSDQKLNRSTYVTIFGLERARELATESYQACRDELEEIDSHALGSSAELAQIATYIYTRDS